MKETLEGLQHMSEEILQELREKIERTDREIVRLLNERAAVSVEIGKTKRAAGREVYDPSREAMVYRHLADTQRRHPSGGGPPGDLPGDPLRLPFAPDADRPSPSWDRRPPSPTRRPWPTSAGASACAPQMSRSPRSSTRWKGGSRSGGSFPSKTPPRGR